LQAAASTADDAPSPSPSPTTPVNTSAAASSSNAVGNTVSASTVARISSIKALHKSLRVKTSPSTSQRRSKRLLAHRKDANPSTPATRLKCHPIVVVSNFCRALPCGAAFRAATNASVFSKLSVFSTLAAAAAPPPYPSAPATDRAPTLTAIASAHILTGTQPQCAATASTSAPRPIRPGPKPTQGQPPPGWKAARARTSRRRLPLEPARERSPRVAGDSPAPPPEATRACQRAPRAAAWRPPRCQRGEWSAW